MNPSHEEPEAASPILSIGRYALFGEIATGGMATVHFGRMCSLGGFNRTVAIKRMRPDIAKDPEFVAMFLDEARLTSRIEHPNVVATLDVVAESGEVFLVMEYVRGETLQRLRRAAKSRREKISVPIAISTIVGALAGLHAAHEAVGEDGVPLGIIHRDVSPQNVMVGEDGIARITDFGIAKAESRLQVTHEGQMKGKLPYMSPEQLGSSRKRIDRRVDVFSAAVVLWELLAGKGLFRADHPGETIAKVLSAPIPTLAPFRSDVTPALDRALRRALSRDPDQRPQTAEEFAVDLEEATDRGPASPRVVGAWVSSLAGDVLANRMKYIREMESTSFNVVMKAGVMLHGDAGQGERGHGVVLDPEPDLVSDPSMRKSGGMEPYQPEEGAPPHPEPAHATPAPMGAKGAPPPGRPRQSSKAEVPPPPGLAGAPALPGDAKVPPPPGAATAPVALADALVPPPPVEAEPPAAEANEPPPPPFGGTPPSPSMPEPIELEPEPLEVEPEPNDLENSSSMPQPWASSSAPWESSSGPQAVPQDQDLAALSIPPFQKNRWIPFAIVGVLVAAVGLLLIVGLVSSSSGSDDPAPEPSSPNENKAAVSPASPDPTQEGPLEPIQSADPEPADSSAKAEADDSTPSEKDKKGGSSGSSKARPTYRPPATTSPTGTGGPAYLPDLP